MKEPRKAFQHAVPLTVSPSHVPTTRVSWDDTNKNSATDAYYCTGSNNDSTGNDMVLIKVRQTRGKSLESLEDAQDNSTRSHLTFSHYTTTDYGHYVQQAQLQQQVKMQHQHLQQQHATKMVGNGKRILGPSTTIDWRRSYDDGDITPTNDVGSEIVCEEGGGTLPRQQRGMLQRAMLNNMPPLEHHHYMNAAAAEYACHSTGLTDVEDFTIVSDPLTVDGFTAPFMTDSAMSHKKIAPEPPLRHCSIRNSRNLSASDVIHQHSQQKQSSHAQSKNYGTTLGAAGPLSALNQHYGLAIYSQQPQPTAQPIYANYASIQQTTAEIHNEKFHDNKSNSSIDSIDTIPFANENTGTIKQRLINRQDVNAQNPQMLQQSKQHLQSSSSSSSSSTNTIANLTLSFQSLKSSASLHDATPISRSESLGSNTSGGSTSMSTCSLIHLRSPTSQYSPLAQEKNYVIGNTSSSLTNTEHLHVHELGQEAVDDAAATEVKTKDVAEIAVTTKAAKVSVNVLNDIGNMLANLTDELDAMLEEEKRVGLNIDSE